MAKDLNKNVLEELNIKVDVLLKKFSEQKGIIDGYVKRERDWKKNKTLNLKKICLLYTSPSPRDRTRSRMPSSA